MKRMWSKNELKKIIEQGVDTLFEKNGRKYKFVACVLRNVGGTWQQIGGDHAPINLDSVSQSSTKITIKYKFKAKNVVSLLVTPDETFSKLGYFCGASVGNETADIQIYKDGNAGGYIAYDTANEVFNQYGDISSASIDASGKITVNHKNIGGGFGRSVFCRKGVYVASIDSSGPSSDEIYLRDYSGNIVTEPDADFRIYWGACNGPELVQPANADQTGNLWVFGIMEI